MEVFISWSGERSRKVAVALHDWLPSVIQSVRPFMSASDIETGSRWSSELAIHLEDAQFGLICVTQENLEAPWLLFEAGALSKSIDTSRVVPFLYGVSQAELQGPLAQFQAGLATKDFTLDVIKSINEASGESGLDATRLDVAFETWWPRLESSLLNIPEAAETSPPPRETRDILEEILHLCRQMSRQNTPSFEVEQDLRPANRPLRRPDTVADALGRLFMQQFRGELERPRNPERQELEGRQQELEQLEFETGRQRGEGFPDDQPSSEKEEQLHSDTH